MSEVYVASSVVRSMVENVSSPTLLMSDVMRDVRDVVGRDVVAGAGLAAAAVVMPLIPVRSRAVIARTESFLRSIKILFVQCRFRVEIYGMFKPAIFSRLDNIEVGIFRSMTFSDLDMSQNDIRSASFEQERAKSSFADRLT